jgi:hypothetical protein
VNQGGGQSAVMGMQANSPGANVNATPGGGGNGSQPLPFVEMHKSDLKTYASSIGYCNPCSENDLGGLFELIFEDTMEKLYGTAKLKELNFGRGFRFKGFSKRNTEPDFVNDAFLKPGFGMYSNEIFGGTGPHRHKIKYGVATELKAMNNVLYLSSNTGQLEGHIENLFKFHQSGIMFLHTAGIPFLPRLNVVTTAGVIIAPSAKLAAIGKVQLVHFIALYRRHGNGRWEFSFMRKP